MVKDVVHIYNGILFSHKKNEMSFAASKMDLEIGIQSEVSQTDKYKYQDIIFYV